MEEGVRGMGLESLRESQTDSRAMPRPAESPLLSVMVPVYNERDNLPILYSDLCQVLESLGHSFEIILIDDGSTDGSTRLLRELASGDPRLRILELVRNYGQTAAMSAGFDHSRGKVIIPLDADLQNDPQDIPRILEKLHEGYDVVSCWRQNRQDSWMRVWPSRVANRLISWMSGVRLHDFGCTLKGYRREILRHVRLYGEMHRFIPIFAHWAGARVAELPVRHHPRYRGRSKYGLLRTFKVPLDLMTIKFLGSYSTKPMYLFGGLGSLSMAIGTLLSVVTLYQKFFEAVKAHRNPLLLLSVFFLLVGIQLILFGLMTELIVRTYHESQGKPTYLVREGSEDDDPSDASRTDGSPAP